MSKKFLFVNENIFTFNSGTEFSAMNRIKLFKQNNVDAKIVTRNFNPTLHQEIKKYGIDDSDIINMYDYFQGEMGPKKHHEYLRYSDLVDKHEYKINGIDNNKSYIEKLGERVAKVSIFPLTVGEIGNVDYYDNFGNISSRDVFDYRGFKSKTIYMHPDGNIGHELVLNRSGNPVIEITHMNIGEQLMPTMFKLLNYKEKTLRFNTEEELYTFFLNEISDKDTVIINDRPSLTVAVGEVNATKHKYQIMHNEHTEDPTQAGNPKAKLYDNLNPLFDHYQKTYEGVITPTEAQKNDLQKRYPKMKFFSVLDSAILEMHKPSSDVTNHEITYMGRVFRDKNVAELISIIPAIKQTIPDVHLTMMGYFESAEFKNELEEIIKQLNIADNVSMVDYKTGKDRENILEKTRILVQSSKGEGLSMSLIEGLSYGIPEVAYDINYGPNEIIDNGKNGYLIPSGDLGKFASQVIDILGNDDKHKQQSEYALKKADKFSADNVMEQWKQLFKTI
ncbi:Poly(ribitol-phosphate)alpha-N-acetylglucosaminyltransferase [Apilactobacillus kunkeei]|nr:Poly(ribitol-phosphate)alpha-N-acetylglucosaminyltransferase [Apilactobacillus kunkeei]CAI2564212.1 Poly(ribitol-phosphate)alpha-N-acetylglucosaminyltransferase [Apilactobacillus kunkeei]CAI2801292.1 Poly(ribitol-phosphate)alpha-N-acetylglucosaminyltransferase [Apilactobacillus kunkeei]